MTENDISKALGNHLQAMSGIPPIYWENQDIPLKTARPYLVTQVVRVSRRELSLAGSGGLIARGFMQVTVIADLDKWATPAMTIADNIAAHFRKGTKLTENGGIVTILDAPDILPALRDGSDWRVNVQCDYEAS